MAGVKRGKCLELRPQGWAGHDEPWNHINVIWTWHLAQAKEHVLTGNLTGAQHGLRQGGIQKTGPCPLGDFQQASTLLWVSIPPSAKWATPKVSHTKTNYMSPFLFLAYTCTPGTLTFNKLTFYIRRLYIRTTGTILNRRHLKKCISLQ